MKHTWNSSERNENKQKAEQIFGEELQWLSAQRMRMCQVVHESEKVENCCSTLFDSGVLGNLACRLMENNAASPPLKKV